MEKKKGRILQEIVQSAPECQQHFGNSGTGQWGQQQHPLGAACWMQGGTSNPATFASTLCSQSKPRRFVWRGGMAHTALGNAFMLSVLAGLNGLRRIESINSPRAV